MDVLQAQRQRLAKALQNDKKGVFSKIYKSYDKRFFDSFGGLNTLIDFLGLNTKNKITLILQNDKGHFMRVLDYANCELYNEIYSQSDPFRSGNANICIQKTTGRHVLMVSGAYQDAPLSEILGFDYLCFKDEFEFSAGVKFTEALKAYQGKKIILFNRRLNDVTKEFLNKELDADVRLVGSYFYEFIRFGANDNKHYENKFKNILDGLIKEN
nr:hypothetical protein [uncultured Campylobacter sp.]DAO52327.1 MAG TPA: hypothetical protein [Caudoviricetes sp.]